MNPTDFKQTSVPWISVPLGRSQDYESSLTVTIRLGIGWEISSSGRKMRSASAQAHMRRAVVRHCWGATKMGHSMEVMYAWEGTPTQLMSAMLIAKVKCTWQSSMVMHASVENTSTNTAGAIQKLLIPNVEHIHNAQSRTDAEELTRTQSTACRREEWHLSEFVA